ncbi:hypothetical protein HZB60_04675 [candidate division KSB1 bacterium]|nr:hypothetical protein [candidate division KSB1 bacterium]
MTTRFAIFLLLLFTGNCLAQSTRDPAFDPPPAGEGKAGKVRWNGSIGLVIINGKVYQQFGLRPDIPFGKWGVGLDLTVRMDADGKIKEDEWDEPADAIEKIYYVRYGQPGDPFHIRIGALDQVTLGYGIVMRRYANTIQYPEIKRVGVYTEGGVGRFGWQGMINSLRELDEPGLLATRWSYETGFKGLTLGATAAADGNQFAGLLDEDDDGVPNRLDRYPDVNDFRRRQDILNLLSPAQIDSLVRWGLMADPRRMPVNYADQTESVFEFGLDAGLPIYAKSPFSLWLYAQAATILDYGYGWAFPGMRFVWGPVELGAEYRHYDKEFVGDYFNFVYELERARLVGDSLYLPKSDGLRDLSPASGYYADALLNISSIGYVYSWYVDMRGTDYENGKTLYGEAGVTPPPMTRFQKIASYYMQPNVREVLKRTTDGTIMGVKLYFAIAQNVSLVYDHRLTYENGEALRTIRLETMVTF